MHKSVILHTYCIYQFCDSHGMVSAPLVSVPAFDLYIKYIIIWFPVQVIFSICLFEPLIMLIASSDKKRFFNIYFFHFSIKHASG